MGPNHCFETNTFMRICTVLFFKCLDPTLNPCFATTNSTRLSSALKRFTKANIEEGSEELRVSECVLPSTPPCDVSFMKNSKILHFILLLILLLIIKRTLLNCNA